MQHTPTRQPGGIPPGKLKNKCFEIASESIFALYYYEYCYTKLLYNLAIVIYIVTFILLFKGPGEGTRSLCM